FWSLMSDNSFSFSFSTRLWIFLISRNTINSNSTNVRRNETEKIIVKATSSAADDTLLNSARKSVVISAMQMASKSARNRGLYTIVLVQAEFIPDSFYRRDKVVPNFFPHLPDVNVDGPGEHIYIGAPDVLQQILPAEDL